MSHPLPNETIDDDDPPTNDHTSDVIGERKETSGNEETKMSKTDNLPPIIHESEGTVEFSVDAIHAQLVCPLCEGLYRDPFTTTKCRHTFCRSCLILVVDAGGGSTCPTCETYLGKDVSKFAAPDHVLEVLIDKVLFPEIAEQDLALEREFYRKRRIEPKMVMDSPEGDALATAGMVPTKRKKKSNDPSKEITLELIPDNSSLAPALEYSTIRTQNTIRIGQIKKYLALKLISERSIDVSCHGTSLGDELTVAFVHRTLWRETSKRLTLNYRFAELDS